MKLFSTILILLCATGAFAQEVVSTGGDSFEADGLYFDVTIGEIVTETFSSTGVTLTQGMQQPALSEIIISVRESSLHDVLLYPNPTAGSLHISLPVRNAEMRLTDLSGKLVKQQSLTEMNSELQLSDLPSGTYLVQVQAETASTVQRIQIIH